MIGNLHMVDADPVADAAAVERLALWALVNTALSLPWMERMASSWIPKVPITFRVVKSC